MNGSTVSTAPLTPASRIQRIRRVLIAILVANWIVAAAKLVFGLMAHSASVTADGLHSIIDGGSNVLALVAMAVAARPADDDHPYGHGKFEAIASLGIAAMIGMAMLELGRMAVNALIEGKRPHVSAEMVAVMVVTLVINLGVTTIERREGERLKSPLLLADARHTLSDVFVTLAVLSSLLLAHLEVPRADGAVALLVLVFVAHVAYQIVRQGVGILTDSAQLPPDQVHALAIAVPGVLACHGVRSRGTPESIWLDLKIEVAPDVTVQAAHTLADAVEQTIQAAIPQVVDVIVHVEPRGHSPGS